MAIEKKHLKKKNALYDHTIMGTIMDILVLLKHIKSSNARKCSMQYLQVVEIYNTLPPISMEVENGSGLLRKE